MSNDIKPGDIVVLPSDPSHKMTVLEVDDKFCYVMWHEHITNKLEREKIQKAALLKAS